jgi:hypothetical protein
LIDQRVNEKKKIALVILNPQYLTSWIDSGLAEYLSNSEFLEVDVFAHRDVADLIPKIANRDVIKIQTVKASAASTHLVAMNWVALRSKSSTFKFSLQRTFRSDYWFFPLRLGLIKGLRQTFHNLKTVLWNLRKKRLTVLYFFKPFRVFAFLRKRRLGKSQILPDEIRVGGYDWLIIPCHAIDELMTDYIAEAKEIGVKSLVAIDNWDNLTSKSVYVVKPDYITVMGGRCIEHARDIHEIDSSSVLPFGLPRFDAYRLHQQRNSVPMVKPKKRILYAGFSVAHSEKRVVDAIADHVEKKYGFESVEVHYRPHPIPIKRIDPYELRNKNTVLFNHGDLKRTRLPGMSSDFLDSMLQADVVIGAPTTLMLEAMLLGRPCVIDLTTDKFHRTTASNSAKHYVHMRDLLAIPGLKVGRTLEEVVSAIDELLMKNTDSTNYAISHLYNTADQPYAEQLLYFLTDQG